MSERVERCREWLEYLLSRPKLTLRDPLHLLLPREGGIYRIGEKDDEESSLWVGETDNLRSCILRGHLRGGGQLRRKMMERRRFGSKRRAADYLKEKCFFQYVIVEDKRFRKLLKHFMIGVLNPELNE
jgi:hypothetical protein